MKEGRIITVFLIVSLLLGVVSSPVMAAEWNSEKCSEFYGVGYTVTCSIAPGLVEPPEDREHGDVIDLKEELSTQQNRLQIEDAETTRLQEYFAPYIWNAAYTSYLETYQRTDSKIQAKSAAYRNITKEGDKEIQGIVNQNNIMVANLKSALEAPEYGEDYNSGDGWKLMNQNDAQIGRITYEKPIEVEVKRISKTYQDETFFFDKLIMTTGTSTFRYVPAFPSAGHDHIFFRDTSSDDFYGDSSVELTREGWDTGPGDINMILEDTKDRIDTLHSQINASDIPAEELDVQPSQWLQEYGREGSVDAGLLALAGSGHDLDLRNTTDFQVQTPEGEVINRSGIVGASPELREYLDSVGKTNLTTNTTLDLGSEGNGRGSLVVVDPDTGEQRRFTSGSIEFDKFRGENRTGSTFEVRTTPSASNVTGLIERINRFSRLEQNASVWERDSGLLPPIGGNSGLLLWGAVGVGLLGLGAILFGRGS